MCDLYPPDDDDGGQTSKKAMGSLSAELAGAGDGVLPELTIFFSMSGIEAERISQIKQRILQIKLQLALRKAPVWYSTEKRKLGRELAGRGSGREVAEARRQGGKASTARRHGGTAATVLGGGASDDAGRGCWAALDSVGGDEEVSKERCGHDEDCRVCREYGKEFFKRCPPHQLFRDGGSINVYKIWVKFRSRLCRHKRLGHYASGRWAGVFLVVVIFRLIRMAIIQMHRALEMPLVISSHIFFEIISSHIFVPLIAANFLNLSGLKLMCA
jgi:hypothetical protein